MTTATKYPPGVGPYPRGAINKAIDALELAYSYLRDKPVIEEAISDALSRLRRANELQDGGADA